MHAAVTLLGRRAPIRTGNMTLVQAMRGIAACWVVLFHAAAGHQIDALLASMPAVIRVPLFQWGHYGVAIFFALSGFVIAHSLRDARVDGRYFARFALRRSIRLDPPYWGAIFVFIALGYVSAIVRHEPYTPPGLATVGAHLVYMQTILHLPELNTVFWTLTYEIQFYFVLCGSMVLATLGRQWRLAKPSGFLALFALALWSACGLASDAWPGLFLNLWHSFFVGALSYWSLKNLAVRVPFAVLVAVMVAPISGQDYAFGLVSALTALMLFGCGMTGKLYTALGWRWIQWLGLISYSLYLLHNPVVGAAGLISRKVLGGSPIAGLATLAAVICASVIISGLYYYSVERPAHRWSRRVTLQKRAS